MQKKTPWGHIVTDRRARPTQRENKLYPANPTFTTEVLTNLYKSRPDLQQIFPTTNDFLLYYNNVK